MKQYSLSIILSIIILIIMSCEKDYQSDSSGYKKPNSNGKSGKFNNDEFNTINSNGGQLSFIIHVPGQYSDSEPCPLVVAFHGGGSDATYFMESTGLNNKADAEGFIVIYPDVSTSVINNDTLLLIDMINRLNFSYSIDQNRIYLTGHSDGGRMAYHYGYMLSRKVAAVAPVAGFINERYINPPADRYSILHLHARNDNTVSYEGARIDSTLGSFSRLFGYSDAPQISTSENLTTKEWTTGNIEIKLILSERGEHQWLRQSNSGIEANDVIWDFFESHPKQ